MTLHLADLTFEPPEAWVVTGTRITLRNADDVTHRLVMHENEWEQLRVPPRANVTFTAQTVGDIPLRCEVHEMHATLHVVAPPATGNP